MLYLYLFLATFLLAAVLTVIFKLLAKKLKIIDRPAAERKTDYRPLPLGGGWAIFLAVVVVLFWQKDILVSGNLEWHHWLGVLAGALLLMLGGTLDDKLNLSSGKQIIFPVLAALAVIAGGVGIEKITNPFSGLLFFDQWKIPVVFWGGHWHYFVVIADIFTFLWLMGMMYTTKLLDGIDGLSSSVGAVASLIIFLFTTTTRYYQPDIAFVALVFAGACLGFLLWNWYPAKIYIGDGGSLLLGFVLGVLSIISGGKIAIALLIMGIPILDVVWAIIRRTLAGHNPFQHADRQHLHFRLQDSGLGARKTVLIYCLFAALFGLSALFLQARGKLLAVFILGLIMLALIGWFNWLDKKNKLA